tara:strand:- start:79 stop:477 length:399 start_codon:yes stop_codon:yes gene_type:complete
MAVKKSSRAIPTRRKAKTSSTKRKPAIKKKYTKVEVLNEIAANTNVSKKDVSAVLDELAVLMERHIKKRAVGEFTLLGLLKIKSISKPAQAAQKGVPDPFRKGKFNDRPRKPAHNRAKVYPLKKLHELVNVI